MNVAEMRMLTWSQRIKKSTTEIEESARNQAEVVWTHVGKRVMATEVQEEAKVDMDE